MQYEDLVYHMPKNPGDEVALWKSLKEEDLERWRNAEVFARYVTYIE